MQYLEINPYSQGDKQHHTFTEDRTVGISHRKLERTAEKWFRALFLSARNHFILDKKWLQPSEFRES
ncbi:hypothetical protein [uncultured Dialister sp.]|jgi:hypothetical protein|uniref:hypothetical protein n=1 Tax=uncultured Dialister sp. TaxID=278064 RepID=UPI0025E6D792|nr:hypothetical protein [uncultured Dialister sp.]